jgi:hypothetical protein
MSCTTAIHRRRRGRSRPASRGFAAIVPLAVAVFSSVLLMTACHSPPTQVARVSAAAADAPLPAAQPVAANPGQVETPALAATPFDEHFYTPPVDDEAEPI